MNGRRLAWYGCIGSMLLALAGCGGPDPETPDAGDAAVTPMDADTQPDGGPSIECLEDSECDDGLFCTGAEVCDPEHEDADARGCVTAPAPCPEDGICREDLAECLPAGCDNPDADADGRRSIECGGDDCDDNDPLRFPGAVEICDGEGRDEDCNPETFGFLDADGDGSASAACCNGIHCGEDCNDADSTVNPRAGDGPPLLCDGVDNDCSGTADEGCPCVEGQTQACGTPAQIAETGLCRAGTQVCSGGMFTAECIGGVLPQAEVCDEQDNDCDGTNDDGVLRTYYTDSDGDGFGAVGGDTVEACSPPAGFAVNDTDCDDTSTGVNPLASEACNGVNDDCDADTDEGVTTTFYRDADGDSFGTLATTVDACIRPTGYVTNAIDCNDGVQAINPAAPEACDGVDNNCNEMTDEGGCSCVDGTTRNCGTSDGAGGFEDRGECEVGTQRCFGGAWGACVGAVGPRAEICNTLDDDCDGTSDEAVQSTFYRDADGDGFGDPGETVEACAPPPGYVGNAGDCDDGVTGVNPTSPELCDTVDNNCDGVTDPGCACTNGSPPRACGGADGMGSGVGECVAGSQTCIGGVWTGCAGSVDPRTEVCNQLDDNCDGTVDEGLTVDCWADPDDDGHASTGAAMETFCPVAGRAEVNGCPIFWTFRSPGTDDCADDDPNRFPGQTESCNGIDDDCDGNVDEGTDAGCAVPNGYGACLGGTCGIVGCAPGYGDCDGDRTNGCEVDTSTDSQHCSACGRGCGGSSCVDSLCESPSGIGSGSSHGCVTFPSGSAACWGLNAFRSLGDGTTLSRPTPAPVLVVDDAATLTRGHGAHSCALTRTGAVQCWGFGSRGQIGHGSNTTSDPVTVIASNAIEIETGSMHTCARLRGAPHVQCWGENDDGQLGDGSTTDRNTPTNTTLGMAADDLGLGFDHTCARTGGTVRCWGANGDGQLGDGSTTGSTGPVLVSGLGDATGEVVGGAAHSCVIRAGGRVACWGEGAFGRLGDGNGTQSETPVGVSGISDAVALSAGWGHTCALRASGQVWCWGRNHAGQLGDGSTTDASTPTAVSLPGAVNLGNVRAISAMLYGTCAITHDDEVYCWGANGNGELGDGSTVDRHYATRLSAFGAVAQIATEGDSSCARRGTGEVLCWGRNSEGQLGDGTLLGRGTAAAIDGTQGYVQVSAARNDGGLRAHGCARRPDGTVLCWGDNTWGQLGDGTTTRRTSPVPVSGLTDAVHVDAGGHHSCAIRQSGQVVCWGFGDALGRAVGSSSHVPVESVGVDDAVDVQAGSSPFTCALRRSGEVWCWGRNSAGQLGDGGTALRRLPAPVSGLDDAVGLTVGRQHACALRADRRVVCWGANTQGQLGDGTTSARFTPTPVIGMTQVARLAAGNDHTCAIRFTGEMFCWGSNGTSQLARSGGGIRPAPVAMDDLGFTLEMSGGTGHSCVLTLDRRVRCVGDNRYDQIRDDMMGQLEFSDWQSVLF